MGGSRVLNTWSRSTWVRVSSAVILPPSSISSPPRPAGNVRSTYRLAMPDSDDWRMAARVPPGSGEWSSSTDSCTTARPSSPSATSCTEPIVTPPVCTGLPFTIWAALSNVPVTV